MSWISEVRERVRDVFLRGREDAEMEEELRHHLELQAAENERLGMTPAEARRQAAIRFGGADRIREEVREERGTAALHDLRGDVRYALRALRRNPGFTVVALLTLALGVGANAAVFSVVNGVLLRPLPYPAPEQLVLLYQSNARSGEQHGRISEQDLRDWAERTRTLDDVAGYVSVPTVLMGRGEPLELELSYVTEQFFDVLRVRPLRGRLLQADDFRQQQRHAVVSEHFWRTVLGGDEAAVGAVLRLRDEVVTVVGVLPGSVRHPTAHTQLWIPQSLVGENQFSNGMPQRGDRYLNGVARLAAGQDARSAEQELAAVSLDLAQAYPESNADWTAATAVPLHTAITGEVDRALFIVLGVVAFILLIGCANLANLMLARGTARGREIAVRVALGAGRRRILRQLLTESVVLAVLGGIAGLVLAWVGVHAILALSADTLPRVEDVRVDGRVLAFGMAVSVLAGALAGMAPALRLVRREPQQDLRGGRGAVAGEGGRLRGALVVAEVALALLLVVGAGLMARSFHALRSVDAGFNPEHVLTVSLQLNHSDVPEEEIGSFLLQRREDILERVRALPGVQHAGMINIFPLRQEGSFAVEYTPIELAADAGGVHADTRFVDPGYIAAMGIPLLQGVALPEAPLQGLVLPIHVSQSLARRLWPGEDPIGRRLRTSWTEAEVVGVVGDVRQAGLAQAPAAAVYFPHHRAPRLMATLVVRTAGEPLAHAAPVRAAIREIDANQPIRSIMPLTAVMAESIARDRFFTLLFALFGGLAIALAAVGIYGVLAYSVRQRTQEIGVRMALGASTVDVLRMVSGNSVKLVGLGIVAGGAAALVLGRVLDSMLFDVRPTDPVTFAGAFLFICCVAAAATWVPARRAMRVPPMTALRPE